jgi:ribosomal-protein-serine acetyltransferase
MDSPIHIRAYEPGDLPLVHAAIAESSDDVGPWLPDLLGGLDPAGLQQWLDAHPRDRQQGTAYHFAITTADGAFLGGCGLTNLNRRHRFANLYYWVRSTATGRGAASAAARQAARFGFEQLGLQRVEIVVDCRNLPSLRVAEKAGATREGVLRSRLRAGETPCDAVMFSLIPADFGLPASPQTGD